MLSYNVEFFLIFKICDISLFLIVYIILHYYIIIKIINIKINDTCYDVTKVDIIKICDI